MAEDGRSLLGLPWAWFCHCGCRLEADPAEASAASCPTQVTGLVVLPLQRYRLQSELSTKVDELRVTLDLALSSQLQIEARAAAERARAIVAPFAELVDATHATEVRRQRRLARCREQLDGLERELAALVRAEPGDG